MRTALCSALLLSAADRRPGAAPPPPGIAAQSADQVASAARIMTPALLLDHIKALASDDKEGRRQGPPARTGPSPTSWRVQAPRPGAWQPGWQLRTGRAADRLHGQATAAFEVKGAPMPFSAGDVVVASRQDRTGSVPEGTDGLRGLRRRRPEYGWDDYKGVDVRGKTLVMLVNDPAVPDRRTPLRSTEGLRGRAMTYYGRWTYKYEIAAKKGAAAAIIIHETGPAGYPFEVV